MNQAEVLDRLGRLYPEASADQILRYAQAVSERMPLIEAAFEAGKRQGRTIRERMEHGKGLWFDEMGPLTPQEREFVISELKRVIGWK